MSKRINVLSGNRLTTGSNRCKRPWNLPAWIQELCTGDLPVEEDRSQCRRYCSGAFWNFERGNGGYAFDGILQEGGEEDCEGGGGMKELPVSL